MSSKYYEGEFHIFDSDNSETVNIQASSGQDLNINCKSINSAGYNSTNGAFKMNNYSSNATQALTAATATRVLFGSDDLIQIVGLDKTTSAPGSVFTNNNTHPLKLMINYSFRVSSGNGLFGRITASWTTQVLAMAHGFDNVFSSPSCNGTVIITMPAGGNFSVFVNSTANTNLSSNNTTSVSTLGIYSLN